ncbi:hypothetical protein WJX77_001481 [Trebouxia sp. C0004]
MVSRTEATSTADKTPNSSPLRPGSMPPGVSCSSSDWTTSSSSANSSPQTPKTMRRSPRHVTSSPVPTLASLYWSCLESHMSTLVASIASLQEQ